MNAAAYIVWCGICWWLRGGKLGVVWRALFKREPGTTITRISCAILMGAPLGFVDPAYALLAVSMYAAMTIGYFDEAMGVKDVREVALMSAWGGVVVAVMLIPFSILTAPALWLVYVGALAGPTYLANRLLGRRLRLDWTERAEILTGCIFGVAIYLAI